jgi:hypothetical protein
MTIKFFKLKEPYGCFSNFAKYPLTLDGKVWKTSEHYYQAQKFLDPLLQEAVRNCETPRKARDMGNDPSLPLRTDWEEVKAGAMRRAIRAKFFQNIDIQETLLSTEDFSIEENFADDSYWANGGGNPKAKNMLGKILMEVRYDLKIKKSFDKFKTYDKLFDDLTLFAARRDSLSDEEYLELVPAMQQISKMLYKKLEPYTSNKPVGFTTLPGVEELIEDKSLFPPKPEIGFIKYGE